MRALFTSPLFCNAGIREQSKYKQQRQQEQDEASLEPRQLLPFLQAEKQTHLTTQKKYIIKITNTCQQILTFLKRFKTCSLMCKEAVKKEKH